MEETNEVKLQAIIDEVPNLVRFAKMMMAIQASMEAYRLYVVGELPKEHTELVGSDQFKTVFSQAVQANGEIMNNINIFINNISTILGQDFMGPMPTNVEEFIKMQHDLEKEIVDNDLYEDEWLNFNKE